MKRIFSLILGCLLAVPSSMMAAQEAAPDADVNAKDGYGNTALMMAALYEYENIVRMLIAAGADVNLWNNGSKTALNIARDKNNPVIIELLEQGPTGSTTKSAGKI